MIIINNIMVSYLSHRNKNVIYNVHFAVDNDVDSRLLRIAVQRKNMNNTIDGVISIITC